MSKPKHWKDQPVATFFGAVLSLFAERLVQQSGGALNPDEPGLTPIDPAFFEHLDLDAYYEISLHLAEAGLEFVADAEPVIHNRTQLGSRTFFRLMKSSDDFVQGGIYQNPNLEAGVSFIFDLETEFSDGRFIMTSNVPYLTGLLVSSGVDLVTFPANPTPFAEMVQFHREWIELVLKENPVLRAVPVQSLEEIDAFQKRLDLWKNQQRLNRVLPWRWGKRSDPESRENSRSRRD